jgi:hypothetical protein
MRKRLMCIPYPPSSQALGLFLAHYYPQGIDVLREVRRHTEVSSESELLAVA